MNENRSPASEFATALLIALVREGLSDVVVCPGSRSQALALAAWQLEQAGMLTLHVRIDERSAAFFALGLGLETGRPAAVVTTSGSAVANLMPAVLEAHHAEVPLLLLTADRPEELQSIRSNQTTKQPGIFGDFVRLTRAVAAPSASTDVVTEATELAASAFSGASGINPGPVHLNLAFRAPLSGDVDVDALVERVQKIEAKAAPEAESAAHVASIILNEFVPTVVVAGAGAGAAAEGFARDARLPLLAEVASGARFGRESITHYRELLRDDERGGLVRRVIVFGVPTLSREVPALVQRDGVETIVVAAPDREFYNPGRRVQDVVSAVRVGPDYDVNEAHVWLGLWVVRDRELIAETSTVHEPNLVAARETGYKERSAYAKSELAAMREPITRAMLAEAVWRASWPHDRLVLGASRLIRELDSIAQPRNIRVLSNRGLAGIDGTVSTASGVATASQAEGAPGATRVLLGDLTALHDIGGLLWGDGEGQPRLQLFVGNDGGGSIFDALEVAQTTEPSAFNRVMYTPQTVSFEHLATAYGLHYTRVSTRSELEAVLTTPVEGRSIVEVTLER